MSVSILLALSVIAMPARAADLRTDLDAFVRKAMKEIGTSPGLSVVVVKGDRVVYRGDFGLRDVEAKLPVTRDTRFYMASTTKAFTAMAAAILASEGKIDLDAPVSTVWPDLVLTPPLDPKMLSLRDLLAMRSGLGNDTLNFRMETGNVSDERELLRLLATYSRQEPRTFRYSNLNYVIAGRVMEKATGRPWANLIEQTVLVPLAMTSTTTGVSSRIPVAKCYRTNAKNEFVETPAEIDALAAPAGAMLTTTADAARWILAMLHDGRLDGHQALPARAVRMVQSAQTTNVRRFRYFDRFAWGLGEDLADYEGDLLVHRFGGLNGAYSHVSFMPDRGVGVAVFANGGGAVPDAVAAYAYDRLLGKKSLDAKWSAALKKAVAAVQSDRERRQQAEAATEHARHAPAHPVDAYAGIYHYDRLGDITVTIAGGRLYAQLGIIRAELVPTGGDSFLVDWRGQGEAVPLQIVFDGDHALKIDWGGRVFDRVTSASPRAAQFRRSPAPARR